MICVQTAADEALKERHQEAFQRSEVITAKLEAKEDALLKLQRLNERKRAEAKELKRDEKERNDELEREEQRRAILKQMEAEKTD